MAKKFFSIIIVPHAKTNVKTLTLSKKMINFLMGSAGVSFLVLVFFLVDYFSMNHLRSKYRNISRENTEQKEKIANYENCIVQLKDTILDFETYAKKLNVMIGLKSSELIKGEPGLGGGEPTLAGDAAAEPDPQGISFSAIQNLAQKAESVGKNLGSLVTVVENQTARLAKTPTIWPAKGWVSSPFGYRLDPFTGKKAFHRGIDIATNFGNPAVATADGTVILAGFDKLFGKNVIVSHGNGIVTHYAHLDKFVVKAGQKIGRGETLGFIGKTGKALGPHLHYEVRINGKAINPYSYILEEE